MFPPLTHVASVSLELIRKPFLYSPLLSSLLPLSILSFATSWRLAVHYLWLPTCALLAIPYSLRIGRFSALLEPQQLAVICRWR